MSEQILAHVDLCLVNKSMLLVTEKVERSTAIFIMVVSCSVFCCLRVDM